MKTKVVINPYSANRSTAKQWADKSALLKGKIGSFDAELTTKALEATAITKKALKDGYQRIIAVGGDGTVNEVINGFFENDMPINPEAILSVIMTGTGGDFRKTAGISKNINKAIDQLANGTAKKIDIGKLTYTTKERELLQPAMRKFWLKQMGSC
jgi:diacylglycerol kinase family enzyme